MELCNGDYLFHPSMNLAICIDFFMAMSLSLVNSLLHVLFCFLLVAVFYAFVTEDKSIVDDVFTSHNLLVVLLLSTPHCQ
jgi:hypothetical protein